jgi:hypothetical protein
MFASVQFPLHNPTKDHTLIANRSPDDSNYAMPASLFGSRMKTGTRALVSK